MVEFGRKQGLTSFASGDAQGDQLIMFSGPQESLFVTVSPVHHEHTLRTILCAPLLRRCC